MSRLFRAACESHANKMVKLPRSNDNHLSNEGYGGDRTGDDNVVSLSEQKPTRLRGSSRSVVEREQEVKCRC